MAMYPPSLIMAPVGENALKWMQTLKPSIIRDPSILTFPAAK